MIIYLVRHAEAISGPDLTDNEKLNLGLSRFGKLEAVAVGKALKRFGVGRVHSSPITRAKETAEIISSLTGALVEYNENLREFSTDLNSKNISYLKDLKLRARSNPGLIMSSGESLNQAIGRIQAALESFSRLPYKSICVVSHRVVIEGLLARLFNIRPDANEWLRTASLTALRLEEKSVDLLFFNRRFRDIYLILETIRRRLKLLFKRILHQACF